MKTLWTVCAVAGIVAASGFGQTTSLRDLSAPKSGAGAPATAKNGSGGVFTQDIDAAKEFAKAQDLPILLFFTGSDWCGWCTQMEQRVFSTQDWKHYAKANLVLVTLDYPKNEALIRKEYIERNAELQRTYNVNGYPTSILLASDGQTVLNRFGGAQLDPQVFIGKLKALTLPARIAKLSEADKAKYEALQKEQTKLQDDLQAWLDTKPDLKNALNKRKQDDFQKRINTVDTKVDALLENVKK